MSDPVDVASMTKEERIQSAVALARNLTARISLRRAALKFNVAYTTVRNRLHGRKPNKEAHENQRHLSKAQSAVILDWCQYKANMAQPLTRNGLRAKVNELSGKTPSDTWIRRFLREHKSSIEAAKGRGLDPKRAQAFNPATVHSHFELLGKVLASYDIPQHNCYNVDEKGIQLGGGRKNLPTQFIFGKGSRDCYTMRSDSLVLVTLIEAVCADGSAVPPGFILPKGEMKDWSDIPGVGW